MIWMQAVPVSIAAAAVFGWLTLMTDRRRGAFLGQCMLALAGAGLFVAISRDTPLLGVTPMQIATVATGVLSAAGAGMLYHLYLGRFDNVWVARGVFTIVFLGLCLVLGLLFLALL